MYAIFRQFSPAARRYAAGFTYRRKYPEGSSFVDSQGFCPVGRAAQQDGLGLIACPGCDDVAIALAAATDTDAVVDQYRRDAYRFMQAVDYRLPPEEITSPERIKTMIGG